MIAFLPILAKWKVDSPAYEVHHACRSPEQAAYLDRFDSHCTNVYAKSENKRLRIDDGVPEIRAGEQCRQKIYRCRPNALMDACRDRVERLGYPEHMLHFERFGADTSGGSFGEPFEADVRDLDSGGSKSLNIPSDRTLLQVLRDAGFDMTSCCESGGCGACKVSLCEETVKHEGTDLSSDEHSSALLSCADRGIGKINIELD